MPSTTETRNKFPATLAPYPHAGGCDGCRAARVCNVCGGSVRGGAGRCTNGRCLSCHNVHCTPGGETSPGHGFGPLGALHTPHMLLGGAN